MGRRGKTNGRGEVMDMKEVKAVAEGAAIAPSLVSDECIAMLARFADLAIPVIEAAEKGIEVYEAPYQTKRGTELQKALIALRAALAKLRDAHR